MKGDRDPATTKKNFGQDSVFSSDDHLRQSKRLVTERASSTTIQDIPEELLVEILCRLPCGKSVFGCKSVSKSWLSLTSDPSFIGRFLWLQRHNQTPIPGTIINRKVKELLTTDLFAGFARFREEEYLRVVATWNDLVLCQLCAVQDDDNYYICNPRTMQHVSLPLTRQFRYCHSAVGFMCEPYYKEEEEEDDNDTDQKEERKVIKIDAEYKYKVVRIIPPEDEKELCFKFKIEVFSSEIGEWRESLVSCPRGFVFFKLEWCCGFASNGMLYWNATDGDLLGLGPLMINNKINTPTCSNSTIADGDLGYQFHVIKLVDRQEHDDLCSSSYHLQAHRGRLQLVQMVRNADGFGARLFVWELGKEEVERMAVQGVGELCQRHRNIYQIMDGVLCGKLVTSLEYFGSDPNDLDTCYMSLLKHFGRYPDLVFYKCNIHTGQCSKMEIDETFEGKAFPIMLPWWPTPVPRICSPIRKRPLVSK